MVVPETDRQQLQSLLKDTITLMCCNSLSQCDVRQINALIGVTMDSGEVVLISINEFGVGNDQVIPEKLTPVISEAAAESSTSWSVKQEVDVHDYDTYHVRKQIKRKKQSSMDADEVAVKQEVYNEEADSDSDDCRLVEGEDNALNASCKKYSESSANESFQNMCYERDSLGWQTVNGENNSEYVGIENENKPARRQLNNNSRYAFSGFTCSSMARSTGRFIRRRAQSSSQRRPISIKSQKSHSVTAGVMPSQLNVEASNASLMAGRALFECTACTSVFTTQLALRSHVNGVHLRVKASRCPDCGESFTWRSGLSRHRLRGLCPMFSADGLGESNEEIEYSSYV